MFLKLKNIMIVDDYDLFEQLEEYLEKIEDLEKASGYKIVYLKSFSKKSYGKRLPKMAIT